MPTGGGKSLCYQLPSLIMDGTAIVVSPLIALMKNQVDVINGLTEDDGVAHFLNSSLNRAAINRVEEDVKSGRTKLLYVAPESLNKEDHLAFFRSFQISFYAIDEAHCISEWGHDFRPEYRNIRPTINKIGNAPVIALTATATDKVRADIKKSLGIMDATEFRSSFNRPNLYYEVRQKLSEEDTDSQIIRFLRQHPGKSGIIYCLSRKKVDDFAQKLKLNGFKAAPYHAGLDTEERNATQDAFLREDIDVIVATIAFGMGIDKPDVRFVIHYDIPKSLEGYYQETGRAGRDGGEGICIAFYLPKDLKKLEKFMEIKGRMSVRSVASCWLRRKPMPSRLFADVNSCSIILGRIIPKITAAIVTTVFILPSRRMRRTLLSLCSKPSKRRRRTLIRLISLILCVADAPIILCAISMTNYRSLEVERRLMRQIRRFGTP